MRFERIEIEEVALPPDAIQSVADDKVAEDGVFVEKRRAMSPVPSDLSFYLNEEQLMALRTMEYFGWRLAFVRRNNLPQSITVILNTDTMAYATIEEDGEVNESPKITIRP